MTDKQLKKLGRQELLEMLMGQINENEALRTRLEAAEKQLEDRKLAFEEAGSIAEAAMRVNGVFEAAQATAAQYLENVERLCAEKSAACEELERQRRAEAEKILDEAQRKCRTMEREAQQQCDEMRRAAEKDANRNWNEMAERLEKISRENAELREMMSASAQKRKWHL